MADDREVLLARTFVELAETLVDEFDIIDLLTDLATRATGLLDAGATGVLLADQAGVLRLVAASNEQARIVELFQLQTREGPCLDCYASGQPVLAANLTTNPRWPRFAAKAVAAGFTAVQALPLRFQSNRLGAFNVFLDRAPTVTEADVVIAQAMADAATIAILQDNVLRDSQAATIRLQATLEDRIAIEQAKGVLAERGHVGMEEAFGRLRRYARDHNRKLGEVAHELVHGSLSDDAVAELVGDGEVPPSPPTQRRRADPTAP